MIRVTLPPALTRITDAVAALATRWADVADRRFAWADDTRRACLLLLLGHVAFWTLYATLSHGNLADSPDMVENWNWGKEWQWGYYKHPPFFAWVVGAWFAILPRADWAYYLLCALNSAVGLAGVFALARAATVDADIARRRLVSVAGLALTPAYGFLAMKFNANAVLVAVWPWAAWAFLAALRSPTVARGAVLGLLLAVAMLSKYASVALVAAMVLTVLLDPERRRLLVSPAMIATVVVAGLAFAPHVVHLVKTDFSTFTYAEHTRAASTGQFLNYFARFPLSQALFMLPLLGALLVALPIADWRALGNVLDVATTDRRRVALLTLLPFLALTAIGVVEWARLSSQWGFAMWFALPWLLVSTPGIAETRLRLPRLAALVATVWGVLFLTAIPTNVLGVATGARVHLEPNAELGREVTRIWREASGGRRLAVVTGTFQLAHEIGFYSPDDPAVLIEWDYSKSPWLTPEKVAASGLAVICAMNEEPTCSDEARKRLGDDLVVHDLTLSKRWYGLSLKPHTYRLLLRLPRAPA